VHRKKRNSEDLLKIKIFSAAFDYLRPRHWCEELQLGLVKLGLGNDFRKLESSKVLTCAWGPLVRLDHRVNGLVHV